MHFYLATPTHWIACTIVSITFGTVTFRLWGDDRIRRGRARKGIYGWLVTAE